MDKLKGKVAVITVVVAELVYRKRKNLSQTVQMLSSNECDRTYHETSVKKSLIPY